jgi:hypothetical protein
MADLLSQADLNALLGLPDEAEPEPAKPKEEPTLAGLQQADLDALLEGLDVSFTPTIMAEAAPMEDDAASTGQTLSQDEIDRMLADFGK